MLSKNDIKLIRTLDQKKYRKANNLFIVEGEKMVLELINSNIIIQNIYATQIGYDKLKHLFDNQHLHLINEKELKQISQLKTPNQMVAIAEIPEKKHDYDVKNQLCIALDNLQDPGNLGTIIRTANWFGVKTIFCSHDSVDAYNPKVIQSTMGAIFTANVYYCNLKELFDAAILQKVSIYGTTLDGGNVYSKKLTEDGIIVMGNESKGLSDELKSYVNEKIFIPAYPENNTEHIESLNVAVATSIVLAEFRRRSL